MDIKDKYDSKSLDEIINDEWSEDTIPRLLDETDEEFRERIREILNKK